LIIATLHKDEGYFYFQIHVKEEELFMLANILERKGDQKNIWAELFAAKQNNMAIQANVVGLETHKLNGEPVRCWVLEVEPTGTVKGIVPRMESGVEKSSEMNDFLGQTIPVMILHIDQDAEQVLCSRIRAIELMQEIALRRMKVGDQYTATVTKVSQNRIVVETSGFSFSFTKSDLKLPYKDLRDVYQVGHTLTVEVKEIIRDVQSAQQSEGAVKEEQSEKVANSSTRLIVAPVLQDKWELIGTKFNLRGVYKGVIKRQFDAGYWVELVPGLDVYCLHPKRSLHKGLLKEGQVVFIQLQRINNKERRLSGEIIRVIG
jgi:ribosomal protein S1